MQLQPQLRPLRPLRPWNMVSSQMGLSGHGIPVYGIPPNGNLNGELLINHD